MRHLLVSSLLLNLTSDETFSCFDFVCIAVHIRLILNMKLNKASALRSRNIRYVLFENSLLRFWIFTLNFLLKLETLLEVKSRDFDFLFCKRCFQFNCEFFKHECNVCLCYSRKYHKSSLIIVYDFIHYLLSRCRNENR